MKRSFYLALLSSGNLILLFFLQWYVIITIGVGMETDALIAGMVVPQFILMVISGSLMHVLVPLLTGIEPEHFRGNAWALFILIGIFFGSVAVLMYLFAPFWVPLLVPKFSEAGKLLTIKLTRIQLVGTVLYALNGILLAISHARQQFIWPEATPLLSTTVSFVAMVSVLPQYGIVAAAWVNVLRITLQTALMLPGLGRYIKPNFRSTAIHIAWKKIKPLILGAAYFKMESVLDRFLSSFTPIGGVTLFYLGQQIYGAANQVINKAFVAPLVPVLAGHAKSKNWPVFRHLYRKRLLFIIGLTGLSYLLLTLIGEKLFVLLGNYGDLTKENLQLLWWIMVALAGVFIGGAMGQILSSVFYAKGNTITITKFGVVVFTTVGIPLKIICFFQFGLLGLAFGSTVYYFFNAFILYVLLERELYRESHVIPA